MTTTAGYARAVCPMPAVVLGQTLKLFTLGHAHLLAARDNGFSLCDPTHEPGPCDLIEAVFICAHDDWAKLNKSLSSPFLHVKLRIWARLIGRFSIPRAMNDFRTWQLPQVSPPLPVTDGRAKRATGTPTIQKLTRWVRSDGMSFADAMMEPFGRVLWDFCADLESKGLVELANNEDLAILEKRRAA